MLIYTKQNFYLFFNLFLKTAFIYYKYLLINILHPNQSVNDFKK